VHWLLLLVGNARVFFCEISSGSCRFKRTVGIVHVRIISIFSVARGQIHTHTHTHTKRHVLERSSYATKFRTVIIKKLFNTITGDTATRYDVGCFRTDENTWETFAISLTENYEVRLPGLMFDLFSRPINTSFYPKQRSSYLEKLNAVRLRSNFSYFPVRFPRRLFADNGNYIFVINSRRSRTSNYGFSRPRNV